MQPISVMPCESIIDEPQRLFVVHARTLF